MFRFIGADRAVSAEKGNACMNGWMNERMRTYVYRLACYESVVHAGIYTYIYVPLNDIYFLAFTQKNLLR